jgi:tetratricopeptide (TPR) repeat protein
MIRKLATVLILPTLLSGCSGADDEGAILRGDRAFAVADYEEALAEYRLALQQGTTEPAVLARVAHVNARLGRIDQARDYYRRAAEGDSSYVDQAVADLIRFAHEAERRSDRLGVSSAIQAALEFRPGINVASLALPLARHHIRNGEFARALPFFQAALGSVAPDSAPDLIYEAGRAYEATGDCRRALAFFEQYLELASDAERGDVSWHLGNCSYRLAESLLADGRDREALPRIEAVIALGEPKSLLPRAHFERGEILARRGECDAAIEAFRQVQNVDPAGMSPLVRRALQRIDEIRFGRPGLGPPSPGRCS